jgi:hypothetical protein
MTAISFQSPYAPQPIAPVQVGVIGPAQVRPPTPGGFDSRSGTDQSQAGQAMQDHARARLSRPTPQSVIDAQALTELGLPKVEMPYPLPTAPIFLSGLEKGASTAIGAMPPGPGGF